MLIFWQLLLQINWNSVFGEDLPKTKIQTRTVVPVIY